MRTLALVVVGFASATAMAQPAPSESAKLFEEGRELGKVGKFAEACDKFEKSYAIDPAVGTELNMADCQEHLGHLAAAWRMFDDAAQRLASEAARQKFARDRADAIVGRLGTVVVKLSDPGVATTVTIGGHVVKPAAEITERVDPGVIAVKVTRADKPALEKSQSVAAGGTITIELGDATGPSTGPPGTEHVGVEERRHSRVILSYGVAGVGAGVFLGGVIIGLVAKSKYSTATKNCTTNAMTGKLQCDQTDFNDAQSAGNLADVGTVVGSIGIAAVVGGAVLYLTAPKDLVVAPMASGQTAGVTISGKF